MTKNTKKDEKKRQANPFSEMEKDVLDFWKENSIFEKSVKNPPAGGAKGDYVFYDGPPFATGTPHYGHIVASIMKDAVPRYWTMRGFKVERRWGWDCHGLPIENIVEKEMGSKSKKDIEALGVDRFNERCRSKVLGYVDEWKKVIARLGRWADMDNAYKTMDLDYMESVWWVFKRLYDKGLIYEGYRSMHICPRCETTLSQQEVAEGYRDVKDLSAIVKFELVDEPGTFVLAWTTTPWTLIGNVALAVGEDIEYVLIKLKTQNSKLKTIPQTGLRLAVATQNSKFIIAKERLEIINDEYEVLKEFKGKDLVGKKYKPLFDYYSKNENLENHKNGWKIYGADFVTTEEGTGIVHIAPAFGEDDMNLGKKHNLPFVRHVGMDGIIKKEAKDFAGKNISPRAKNKPEEIREIDLDIVRFLGDKIFDKEKYVHSYPHCWRCDTALINYATSSWFVNITKIKSKLLETAKGINWTPAHIKEGRFGKWLEGARDWSISRQRFWAGVIPIWKCGQTADGRRQTAENYCKNIKVFGSIKEIEEASGQEVNDLHKHTVDKITFECDKCGGEMRRVPDVLDCWFESGSMPYAQAHYPFENKEKFEKNFPAEFIAEGVDQTRAWFYYLHAIAGGVKGSEAFKNVIVNGIVLAEDGKKMSKKLQNYPDPNFIFDKYGADALRYYLLTSPVMLAENLNFSEKGVQESLRNVVMILWNVVRFYEMYATDEFKTQNSKLKTDNILDEWILARLNRLIGEVTENMNNYNLPKAARPIEDFTADLSTWYIRRSRDRFKGGDEKDKKAALETTGCVLLRLSKIMAPFMPFIAEQVWQKVSGNDFKDGNKSVHLEGWPIADERRKATDDRVLEEMEQVRKIVELGLAERDKAKIKIRQPLSELRIKNYKLRAECENLVKDELNVKNIKTEKGKGEIKIELNTELTPELKMEGAKREVVRLVNALRKQAGMTIRDKAIIYYEAKNKEIKEVFEKMGKDIMNDTLSDEIVDNINDAEEKKEVKVNGEEVILGVKKI